MSAVVFSSEESDRLWNDSQKMKKIHNYEKAIEMLKRAIIEERKQGNPRKDELLAYINEIGTLYGILGDNEKCVHYYALLVKVSKDYSDIGFEVTGHNALGESLFNMKRYDDAIMEFKKGVNIAEKMPHGDMKVVILNNIAKTYRYKKDFNNALTYYNDALGQAKKVGNESNIPALMSNIGIMYMFQKRFDRALDSFSQALERDRILGKNEMLSSDLSNIGITFTAMGRYNEAIRFIEKALESDRANKNDERAASRLFKLGDLYQKMNDNMRALEFFKESLTINERLNNRVNLSEIYYCLGVLHESMEKPTEALDYFLKSIELSKDVENKENLIHRIGDIGLAYETRQRYGEAVDYLGKALLQNMMSEKQGRIADTLSAMGRVMNGSGQYDKALSYFNQALEIYREMKDDLMIGETQKNCGISQYHMKNYSGASRSFMAARSTLADIPPGEKPKRFGIDEIYEWEIASLVREKSWNKILEVMELYSKNMESTMLGQPVRKSMSASDIQSIKAGIPGNAILVCFSNSNWDNPVIYITDGKKETSLELNKASFMKRMYDLKGGDIESFARNFPRNVYYPLKMNNKNSLFAVEFQKTVNYYRYLLSKKHVTSEEKKSMETMGREFYRFLFGSVEPELLSKKELIIRADGPLAFIPMDALVLGDGRYLIEQYDVRYLHSCSQLFKELNEEGAGSEDLIVMGNSSIPVLESKKVIMESSRQYIYYAELIHRRLLENGMIGDLLGIFLDTLTPARNEIPAEMGSILRDMPKATLVEGSDVPEAGIKKMSSSGKLQKYRMMYLAVTGVVVPEFPELSSLVFFKDGANDGFLDLLEISTMKLPRTCVIISSMHVAKNGFFFGEGLWNICRVINRAGAKSVCMPLWEIEDAGRAMVYRYAFRYMKKGMRFHEGLMRAKRDMVSGVEPYPAESKDGSVEKKETGAIYKAPYYWASTVYYGK